MTDILASIKKNMTKAIELIDQGDSEKSRQAIKRAMGGLQSLSPDVGIICVPVGTSQIYFPDQISRCETIHHKTDAKDGLVSARRYVTYNAKGIEVSIQDDGRTAKLFIKNKGPL